jgi:4-amino-4-deoxy-L-arabinose transferase-like glycosyltransferase
MQTLTTTCAVTYPFVFYLRYGNIHAVNSRQITWVWWASVIALLLLIFGLRTYGLLHVPPGLTHDEASNGHDSNAILSGVHRLYFPVGYGHEPLYNYSVALVTRFLGQGIYTLRITTVFWSLGQVILTTALARRWWGRGTALGVLAGYTASFWALMMGRVGLRAPTLPPILTASILIFDRSWVTPRRRYTAVLAGALLGTGFYTYMASRGTPLLYIGLLCALFILDRNKLEDVWQPTLIVLLTAALVGLPLFLLLRAHPELESRIAQLGGALQALGEGNWRPLMDNIKANAPMLFWTADPRWLYNIPGRPALEPLLAGLFLVGIGTAFTQLRTYRSILTLLWLAVGLAPALVVPIEYNTLHAIAAMPPIFLLIGLGVQTLTRLTCHWHIATILLLIVAFGFTGVRTAHAYFVTWGEQRDVHVAYHHHVVALGRHLEQLEGQPPIVITSLYPGEFHDPYTMEVTLRRQDLDLRWCDARYALIVPKATSRLYVEEQTTPTESFDFLLDGRRQRITTLDFGADAIPSQIKGYQWESGKAWDDVQPPLNTDGYARKGDPPPNLPHQLIAAPINFGDTLTFAGYTIQITEQPANSLELLTAWEVIQPPDQRLLLFSHLLSSDGELLSQSDRLDAPSWQWQSGDRFVQRHQLQLPDATPCNACSVAVGLYVPATLTRLPVCIEESLDHDGPAPTRILIPLNPAMSQEKP